MPEEYRAQNPASDYIFRLHQSAITLLINIYSQDIFIFYVVAKSIVIGKKKMLMNLKIVKLKMIKPFNLCFHSI